ncbi:hypothetical protein HK104_003124 [Borealophlyctis nickersoniae]|nr:hypothetical protein HK104_003124 [Borealophlyctis nickersoniae]
MDCVRIMNNLAGRLDIEFGLRNNTALDETKLKEFVHNADTFQWFNERFPKIAERMLRGLDERNRPPLDEKSRKIQEFEERLHRAEALLGGGTKRLRDKGIRAEALLGGGTKHLRDKDTDSNSRTHFANESESESESDLDLDLDLDFEKVLGEMSSTSDTIPEPSDRTVANTGSSSSGTAAQRSDRTVAYTFPTPLEPYRLHRVEPSDRTVANTAPRDKGKQREETNGTGSSSTKRKLLNTVTNEMAQKKPKT